MEASHPLHYLLCPRCQRVVPASTNESYCPNDGSRLLEACPQCRAIFTSPYSRFCTACGKALFETLEPH